MRISAIIQARLGSTRLPRKVLLPLDGCTVLETVIKRVRKSKYIGNDIIITTPDVEIGQLAFKVGVHSLLYDGERNVLKEYWLAAKHFGVDVIVRITADCPLIEPERIDALARIFIEEDYDIVYNTRCEDGKMAGDGTDVEIFSFSTLTEAYTKAANALDREHVTRWMRKNLKDLYLPVLDFVGCSLNTIEDYKQICKIIDK